MENYYEKVCEIGKIYEELYEYEKALRFYEYHEKEKDENGLCVFVAHADLAYRLYLEGDQEYGRKFESLCQIIEKIPGNKTNFKWLQLKSEMEEDKAIKEGR